MDVAFGILMICVGIVVAFLALKKNPFISSQIFSVTPPNEFDSVPSYDTKEQLKRASSGQTVKLIGESEKAIKASVTLNEMFQRQPNSPWSKTGLVSKVLVLAGDILIFKVPSEEAGKPTWLKGEEVTVSGLGKFYKGTDASPGPARVFKQNDQSDPVPYYLPKNITPKIIWKVVDIGTFDTEVDGASDNFYSGDRLYFVTSKEKDGDRWLVYLDARKGEANGSGGLFLLMLFASWRTMAW